MKNFVFAPLIQQSRKKILLPDSGWIFIIKLGCLIKIQTERKIDSKWSLNNRNTPSIHPFFIAGAKLGGKSDSNLIPRQQKLYVILSILIWFLPDKNGWNGTLAIKQVWTYQQDWKSSTKNNRSFQIKPVKVAYTSSAWITAESTN